MSLNQLSVRADNDPRTMTLSEFLKAPEEILGSADERIWFGSEETFEHLPSESKSLHSAAEIVQFHSDPVVQELLEVCSRTVNACLGFSGLTSVGKAVVDAVCSSREFDLSANGTALNPLFLLALADRCRSWNVLSAPESSFRYFSSLPVYQPASGRELLDAIRLLSDDRLTKGNPAGTAAVEIRAGLLLIHDYLEPSHQYSQSIQGAGPDLNGDYWHGIMHRREPDFGNAKYWFRRVGDHPCFVKVAETARQLTQQFQDPRATEWVEKLTRSGWDSIAAVDFFQEAHMPQDRGSPFHQFASCLQMQEMLILLRHCCPASRR